LPNESQKLATIFKLLDPFIKKFFVQWPIPNNAWAVQTLNMGDADVAFDYVGIPFKKDRLVTHFRGKPLKASKYGIPRQEAAYGFRLPNNGRVKVFCLDVDHADGMKALHEKILPVFDEHEIEYIYEYGGAHREKAHVWFFCDTEVEILKSFVEKLLRLAGVDCRKLKLELYGSHLKNNVIRLFGGYHLRAGRVNEILFRGEESNDPVFMLEAAIACEPVTLEKMLEVIGVDLKAVYTGDYDPKGILRTTDADGYIHDIIRAPREVKYFVPQKLSYKFDDGQTEPYVHRLFSECQAINRLLKKVENDDFLDIPGEAHRPGLFFSAIFKTGEKIAAKSNHAKDDYRSAAERFYDQYRMRPPESHGWGHENEFNVSVPRCETFESEFDECKGCPHKGREGFENPNKLWSMKPLKIVKEKEIKIDSAEAIAKRVWKRVNNKIADSLDHNTPLKLFIKSPQQTYKTTNLCRTSAKLAGAGYDILILCPTGRIAKEMYERLAMMGVRPYLLMSHKNLMRYFKELKKITFVCPDAEDIEQKQDLGYGRRAIAKAHCYNCPFLDECPYPNQYRNLLTTKKRIVIAQHAHASIKTVSGTMMQRHFDLTFVDETFVDSMFEHLQVTKSELEVLNTYPSIKWIKELASWLTTKKIPKNILHPRMDQLRSLRKSMIYYEQPWNVMHYIRAYNNGEQYHPKEGVVNFTPWIKTKRMVITNATAPVKISATLLNIPLSEITQLGASVLVDCKHYNPNNEMIKIIDNSTSVTSMSDARKLEKILRWIGMKAETDWASLSILVTTYSSMKEKVELFFQTYFKEASKRIQVANMAVGTNEWKDTNVQILLAGVHLNALDLKRQTWKYKKGINYWREQRNAVQLHNPYPYGVRPTDPLWMVDKPVTVNLMEEKNGRRTATKITIPDLTTRKPVDEHESMVDWMTLGQTQQADRIRTFDDKLKIFMDFSNRYHPGLMYTRIVFLDQLFGELGIQ
jgi:hypothetical protein